MLKVYPNQIDSAREGNRYGRGTPLFISVDIGTGSAKATAINLQGDIIAECRHAYETTAPHAGWAEQNPNDWIDGAMRSLAELAAKLPNPDAVSAIGLTGQTPTFAPVDAMFKPVGPGILYRDNRASEEAQEIRNLLGAQEIHSITGHFPAAFHIAPKLLWLRKHQSKLFAASKLFLQPRDMLLQRLTGVLSTDETHANSTLLYNLTERSWSDSMFSGLRLDPLQFPSALPSGTDVGTLRSQVARELGLSPDCHVILGGADSQTAAYGSGLDSPGAVSEMAGTSSCVNTVIRKPIKALGIDQYAHVLPNLFTTEIGVNTTGAALQWAISRFGFHSYADLSVSAAPVHQRLRNIQKDNSLDVAPLFLPFLADGDRGNTQIRACFLGLSARHERAEIAYSVLEGVAFSIAAVLTSMRRANLPTTELRVAGGGATLDLLGRIKADALGIPVLHMLTDTAAVGAGFLAARSMGYAKETSEAVQRGISRSKRFNPSVAGRANYLERFEWYSSVLDSPAITVPQNLQ